MGATDIANAKFELFDALKKEGAELVAVPKEHLEEIKQVLFDLGEIAAGDGTEREKEKELRHVMAQLKNYKSIAVMAISRAAEHTSEVVARILRNVARALLA